MSERPPRVIIVGGGITGLAAAHRLVEKAGDAVDIRILEATNRPGGVIHTHIEGDLLLELGPDSIITEKPWAVDLCRRLGIDGELIPTQAEFRRTLVVRDGKLLPLPEAFQMMAPGKLRPFLASKILSWPGRLRALLDLVLPRGGPPPGGDETLGSFVRRRLGREVLERIAQPVIGGIYTADPEKLSLGSTMPRFLELERKHRSVILGLLRQSAAAPTAGTSGARFSLFTTPRCGVSTLVDALLARLPEGTLQPGRRVRSIEHDKIWKVDCGDEILEADAVIMALPAPRASETLNALDRELATGLGEIEYASTAVAVLAYRRADLELNPEFFGIVVPARERRGIIAISFPSVKFAGRAPDEIVTLRIFLGGALAPDVYAKDDEELLALARDEAGRLLGARQAPTFARLQRHPESMPQYHAGHALKVLRIEERAGRHAGLALAGNAYHGVGLPDSIHSGEQAADSLLAAGVCGRAIPRDETPPE